MSNFRPAPITDAEITRAVRHLEDGSSLTRRDLERIFDGDRRGRLIMAEIVSRGIAPIVTVDDRILGRVYRLARTPDEYESERRQLQSRIRQLERRLDGLNAAWESGVRVPQQSLFAATGESL